MEIPFKESSIKNTIQYKSVIDPYYIERFRRNQELSKKYKNGISFHEPLGNINKKVFKK